MYSLDHCTGLEREVAVFGAAWIDVPLDFLLEKYLDIERFDESLPPAAGFVEINIPTG